VRARLRDSGDSHRSRRGTQSPLRPQRILVQTHSACSASSAFDRRDSSAGAWVAWGAPRDSGRQPPITTGNAEPAETAENSCTTHTLRAPRVLRSIVVIRRRCVGCVGAHLGIVATASDHDGERRAPLETAENSCTNTLCVLREFCVRSVVTRRRVRGLRGGAPRDSGRQPAITTGNAEPAETAENSCTNTLCVLREFCVRSS
jgi:hypothetical protein